MPLLEFIVGGPPASYQAKDKARLSTWKQAIRAEAARSWGTKPPLTGKLKCTIINFHEGTDAPSDDDNMVKPIRDALNQIVYMNDLQITYSETIQVSIDAPIKVRKASAILFAGYNKGDQFVYVRIDHAPDFIQLPQ